MLFNWKELKESIRLEEAKADQEKFISKFGQEAFDKFQKYKQRLKNKGISNDILYHVKNTSVEDMVEIINDLDNTQSKNQQLKAEKAGADLLYVDDNWKIYRINTYDASKYYGKGTVWCISGNYPGHEGRGQHYFDSYLKDNYSEYYFFIRKDDTKWAVCPHKDNPKVCDVWDSQDGRPRGIPDAPVVDGIPDVSLVALKITKDGVLIGFDENSLRAQLRADKGTLYIPKKVKSIKKLALFKFDYGWTDLNGLVIPEGVTSIGNGAFGMMTGSDDRGFGVILPKSLTSLGEGVFLSSNVRKITFPEGLISIPRYTLAYNDLLETVILPASIQDIHDEAFKGVDKDKVMFICPEGSYAESWAKENDFGVVNK